MGRREQVFAVAVDSRLIASAVQKRFQIVRKGEIVISNGNEWKLHGRTPERRTAGGRPLVTTISEIPVTTSGYGKAAFEFAEGKPLELLSGSHLLYLLEQHAGMKAKIEVPETWKDPIPDTVETAGRLP